MYLSLLLRRYTTHTPVIKGAVFLGKNTGTFYSHPGGSFKVSQEPGFNSCFLTTPFPVNANNHGPAGKILEFKLHRSRHSSAENATDEVIKTQEALKGMNVKRISAGEMGLNEY
jgi:hypothetical protein